MQPRSLLFAAALATATLPAQMSGNYVIDTTGAGGAFPSFTAAVNALFVNGVSGPVELLVMPGTYTESILVPPIQGASSANTITFRAVVGPGTVLLGGAGGDTFALLGVAFLRNRSLVFDGIEFTGGPGFAISGSAYCEDMEVRHCTFHPNHRNNAPGEFRHALITSENRGGEAGWRVHHNHMTVPSRQGRTAYGIYLSNGGGWEIHHNDIDLNGCDHGLYLINDNTRLDTIYNNLFHGSLASSTSQYAASVAAISVNVSNFNNDIAHNTFVVTIPGNGCLIASAGYNFGQGPVGNRLHGNVFVLLGSGVCICLETYQNPPVWVLQSDGNVFWAPNGEIGRLNPNNPGSTTLAAWQAASTFDLASVQQDPLLTNTTTAPFDLHPLPGSPVQNRAVNTPAFVVDDYDGRLRDSTPDAGAYEMTSFAFYGAGCRGTGGLEPAMGSAGTVALGSPNFAITLAQAAGNTVALLFGGGSRTQAGPTPLPFDLGGGCRIQADPASLVSSFTSPAGAAQVALPIPNNPSLRGTNVFFQWGVIDSGSGSPFGITVSNGGALQL